MLSQKIGNCPFSRSRPKIVSMWKADMGSELFFYLRVLRFSMCFLLLSVITDELTPVLCSSQTGMGNQNRIDPASLLVLCLTFFSWLSGWLSSETCSEQTLEILCARYTGSNSRQNAPSFKYYFSAKFTSLMQLLLHQCDRSFLFPRKRDREKRFLPFSHAPRFCFWWF